MSQLEWPAAKAVKPLFDIDYYLDPYIPRSRLYLLPKWISHFFGHREPSTTSTPSHQRTFLVYASCFIGASCGVAIIESVYQALPLLSGHQVPVVLASFGAAAILEYNAIESPLAQPRNLLLGHVLSAVIGVGITKLFLYLPPDRFQDLQWLAGALAVGVASVAMSLTKTVHPPAGATALIAATSADVTDLGWWLPPLVLLASMLMLASALLLNNITNRRFPVYWWTPIDLEALHEKRKDKNGAPDDIEKASKLTAEVRAEENISVVDTEAELETPGYSKASQDSDRSTPKTRLKRHHTTCSDIEHEIIIEKARIIVPDWLELNDWERNVLHILQGRLRDNVSVAS